MTTRQDALPPARANSTAAKLVVPCLIGALVALTLGIYGKAHHPTGIAINIAGFSSPGSVKSWLATGATVFAIIQVGSALVMYGKIPRVTAPDWIGGLHRWSGRIAFLMAVPVAIHCLYALGFQQYSTRVLAHSLLGCAFFGAFTVKMLILPKRGLPGWVLPVVGAVVFTVLVIVWFTSAYWFFSTFGIKRLGVWNMAEPSVPASSRRTMLACAGAACAAVLAGCSTYNSNNGGVAGSQPAPASSSAAPPTEAGSGTAAGPAALASTSDVPVGGGKILTDKKIVITQPHSGDFQGFSAVCTHAGCIVGSVSGGTINCPCHGSRFSITNGSVVNGPAGSPLPPVDIKVQGTSIVQA